VAGYPARSGIPMTVPGRELVPVNSYRAGSSRYVPAKETQPPSGSGARIAQAISRPAKTHDRKWFAPMRSADCIG